MGIIKNTIILGLIVFFFAVIIVSFDLSYTGNIVREDFNVQYAVSHPSEVVSEYNQKFERIPNFARTLLGNEDINLIISMDDGSEKDFNMVTKQGKIIAFQEGLMNTPTIIVTTSEDTINNIASSKTPADDFAAAVKDKTINIESKRIFTSIKIFAAKTFMQIKGIL